MQNIADIMEIFSSPQQYVGSTRGRRMRKSTDTRGGRISDLRSRAGYKGETLAKELAKVSGGVYEPTKQTVSDWENNKTNPPLEVVILLAKILGTTTDYLLCAPWADKPQWRYTDAVVEPLSEDIYAIARQIDVQPDGLRRMIINRIPATIAECAAIWGENNKRLALLGKALKNAKGEKFVRELEKSMGVLLPTELWEEDV